MPRFLQGYLYPSFTGSMTDGFASPEAVVMWQYLRDLWLYVDRSSLVLNRMDKALLNDEVWVAWDHSARLVQIFKERPEDFVAGCRMLTMINTSIDMYKMENGTYTLTTVAVEVPLVIKQIQASLAWLVQQKRLTWEVISYARERAEALSVLGENLLVYSLLANLLKNAAGASLRAERSPSLSTGRSLW